jgi:hypothetical protein
MSFRHRTRRHEQGYVLLLLLLFFAILSIGFLEAAKYDLQYTVQQIKRDREEELVHRGVQYSRAIRKFYKKFGRYPTRIEELENTNNYRSLRKRYKDPITGKDFKLLHLTDVRMFGSGPTGPGITPAGQLNQQAGAPGALDGSAAGPGGVGPGAIGGTQAAPAATGGQSDASSVDAATAAASATPTGAMPQAVSLPQTLGANGQPQVFGGSGIVGVASLSKDKTIREFNKKNHYNQWQFIYDPSTDRGGLLMTPNQPPLQGVVQTNQPANGQGGINGMNPAGGFSNMPMNPQPPQNPGPTQP